MSLPTVLTDLRRTFASLQPSKQAFEVDPAVLQQAPTGLQPFIEGVTQLPIPGAPTAQSLQQQPLPPGFRGLAERFGQARQAAGGVPADVGASQALFRPEPGQFDRIMQGLTSGQPARPVQPLPRGPIREPGYRTMEIGPDDMARMQAPEDPNRPSLLRTTGAAAAPDGGFLSRLRSARDAMARQNTLRQGQVQQNTSAAVRQLLPPYDLGPSTGNEYLGQRYDINTRAAQGEPDPTGGSYQVSPALTDAERAAGLAASQSPPATPPVNAPQAEPASVRRQRGLDAAWAGYQQQMTRPLAGLRGADIAGGGATGGAGAAPYDPSGGSYEVSPALTQAEQSANMRRSQQVAQRAAPNYGYLAHAAPTEAELAANMARSRGGTGGSSTPYLGQRYDINTRPAQGRPAGSPTASTYLPAAAQVTRDVSAIRPLTEGQRQPPVDAGPPPERQVSVGRQSPSAARTNVGRPDSPRVTAGMTPQAIPRRPLPSPGNNVGARPSVTPPTGPATATQPSRLVNQPSVSAGAPAGPVTRPPNPNVVRTTPGSLVINRGAADPAARAKITAAQEARKQRQRAGMDQERRRRGLYQY